MLALALSLLSIVVALLALLAANAADHETSVLRRRVANLEDIAADRWGSTEWDEHDVYEYRPIDSEDE